MFQNIQLQLQPNTKQKFYARVAKLQFVVNGPFIYGDCRGTVEVSGKEKPLVADHGIESPVSPLRSEPNKKTKMNVGPPPVAQDNPTSLRAPTHGNVDASVPFDIVDAYRRQLLDHDVRDFRAFGANISSDNLCYKHYLNL